MSEMTAEEATKQLAAQMREKVVGPESMTTEGDSDAIRTMANDPEASHSAAGFPQPQAEVEVAETSQEDSVTEEVTEAPEAEVAERTKLSSDEMQEMYATGVVNGEEVEYSLDKLLAIAQTQDAASDRLDRTKGLERELRNEIDRVKDMQTALTAQPETKPEFMTEQDEQLYNLQQELSSLKGSLVQTETQRLVEAEDAQIRQIAKEELGTEDMGQVATLIEQVQKNDPNFAAVTSDLFSRNPTDQSDMQRRLAMFRSTIAMGKGLEVPSIVRAAKAEGLQEGKKETMEKVKKESLTTVSSTAPAPQESEYKQLRKAASQPGIGGFVDVWKSQYGATVPKS